MKMSCLPEGVNWNNKEFTKEMLDYMRAVYCMHPMVLDALDYIDSIESRIAELKAFIDQLIEAGDDIADDYCNDTLTPYGLQIVKNWQALIKDWKER